MEDNSTTESKEKRDGRVEVSVDSGRMEASIKIIPAIEGVEVTYDDAIRELRNNKVVYGINEELLNNIFEDKLYDTSILIAEGLPPIDGIDGEVKYYFERNRVIKPKEDEKGNVDFKDINLIQGVKKHQKLAEVIPPKPGTEGKNVFNEEIPPREGKICQLPQGRNTMPGPENPNILISAMDGHILFKGGGLVEVESDYVIIGNIDFNTGNLDYSGSVLIKGDVKSGFEVNVEGDLDIWGVVEDAKIKSGGNVLLQKGIIGRGAGIVESEKGVIAKYVENQNIRCKGNVVISEAILHSKVYTDGFVLAKGKRGYIIGGEIIATAGVEVKNLGNYQNVRTEVTVGIKEETKKKLIENELNFIKNKENENNVKKAIYQLIQLKYSKNGLSKEKTALLTKMQNIQKVLPTQKAELEKEKEEISKEFQKYKNAQIKVYNKVYPGVKISIVDKKYTVLEERSGVVFRLSEDEVVCAAL